MILVVTAIVILLGIRLRANVGLTFAAAAGGALVCAFVMVPSCIAFLAGIALQRSIVHTLFSLLLPSLLLLSMYAVLCRVAAKKLKVLPLPARTDRLTAVRQDGAGALVLFLGSLAG